MCFNCIGTKARRHEGTKGILSPSAPSCLRTFVPSCLSHGGFSLIEMTAVLALMAILASIVTVNVRHHLIKGKQNAARAEISTICDALEAFYSACGRYPTTEEGLTVLCQRSEKLPEPLLKQMPIDPWGHAYQYNQPGRNSEPYEVVSFGADGREGGDGANADIYSWNLKDSSTGAAHATTH